MILKGKKYEFLPPLDELNRLFGELKTLPENVCPKGVLKVVRVSQFTRSGFTAISIQDKIYNVIIPRRFKKNRRLNRVKVGNLTLVAQVFNGKKAILAHVYTPVENELLKNHYFDFTLNQNLFSNDF